MKNKNKCARRAWTNERRTAYFVPLLLVDESMLLSLAWHCIQIPDDLFCISLKLSCEFPHAMCWLTHRQGVTKMVNRHHLECRNPHTYTCNHERVKHKNTLRRKALFHHVAFSNWLTACLHKSQFSCQTIMNHWFVSSVGWSVNRCPFCPLRNDPPHSYLSVQEENQFCNVRPPHLSLVVCQSNPTKLQLKHWT